MTINSTTLSTLKSIARKASGANAQKINVNLKAATNIFQEYEQYKAQMANAQQNGGATNSTSNVSFGTPSISVSELETKISNCETEFKNYYALINEEQQTGLNKTTGKDKDEQNKIQSKGFKGLMA